MFQTNTASDLTGTTNFVLANMPAPIETIDLAQGRDKELKGDHRFETIACSQGRLWITQQGDANDYIIDEGEAFVITRRGKLIIRALKDSSFGISPSINQTAKVGRFRQLHFA